MGEAMVEQGEGIYFLEWVWDFEGLLDLELTPHLQQVLWEVELVMVYIDSC